MRRHDTVTPVPSPCVCAPTSPGNKTSRQHDVRPPACGRRLGRVGRGRGASVQKQRGGRKIRAEERARRRRRPTGDAGLSGQRRRARSQARSGRRGRKNPGKTKNKNRRWGNAGARELHVKTARQRRARNPAGFQPQPACLCTQSGEAPGAGPAGSGGHKARAPRDVSRGAVLV
jgi:hypothetical protein